MSAPRLRCVTEEMLENIPQTCEPETVSVSVGDMVPLLLDAAITNRLWLEDFADETVSISQDFYEVLLAYRGIAGGARRVA